MGTLADCLGLVFGPSEINFHLALRPMKDSQTWNEQEILEVVRGFQARTIPKERWTHQAHLVTALWYHVHHTPLESICYLRSGIIEYNASVGGKNTPEDGYHETLTLFWCKVISSFVEENQGLPLAELTNKFLASEMATKEYPMKFYSRERLFSLEARASYVAPTR